MMIASPAMKSAQAEIHGANRGVRFCNHKNKAPPKPKAGVVAKAKTVIPKALATGWARTAD